MRLRITVVLVALIMSLLSRIPERNWVDEPIPSNESIGDTITEFDPQVLTLIFAGCSTRVRKNREQKSVTN